MKDSIPKFDGKSSSLVHFIKQCRLANSKVRPEDRENLLFLIRNKIEGHAKLVLSNSKEPETLDELFGLLKKFYLQSFNVHSFNAQLMQLHQNPNESVDVFGTRVSEILNGGLETAKDIYNAEQLVGVNDLLKNSAMISFIKGICNDTIRFYLNRENDKKALPNLEFAINKASNLNAELVEHSNSKSSFIQSAKIFKADFTDHKTRDDRICFRCNQTGHISYHCPSVLPAGRNQNQTNFRNHIRTRCRFCKKSGHEESHCFRKQNINNTNTHGERFHWNNHLNLKLTPRKGATRSEPLIASAKPSEHVLKSK